MNSVKKNRILQKLFDLDAKTPFILKITIPVLFFIGVWTTSNLYFDYKNMTNKNYELLELRVKQHEMRVLDVLDGIDFSFKNIADDIYKNKTNSDKNLILAQYIKQLKSINQLFLSDKTGQITAGTNPSLIGFDARNSEYFKYHIQNLKNNNLHISKPFVNIYGIYALNISKMMIDSDGTFLGVIVIEVACSYFENALKSDTQQRNLIISLISDNGDVLSSSPQANMAGKNIKEDDPFAEHLVSNLELTRHLSKNRVSVIRNISNYPLILFVSERFDDLIFEWYWHMSSHIFSFILLSSLILLLLRYSIKQQDFLQDTMDSIPSQIAVIDHNGFITAVNKAWVDFSIANSNHIGEMASHTHIGTNYLSICSSIDCNIEDKTDAEQSKDGILAILDGRLSIYKHEYPCHSPYEQRWFSMSVTPLGKDKKHAVIVHTNITERKLAEINITNLAYYDTLTSLPNRRLLSDRLSQAILNSKRSGLHGALMLIDLDNFKPLNDTFGHAMGDLLLIEVAARLYSCVRQVDTVARLGGDEFIVIISGLKADYHTSELEALSVAHKIASSIASPYDLTLDSRNNETIRHHCSASIGITLFIGQETTQENIIKQADAAMYKSKSAGKNSISFYEIK